MLIDCPVWIRHGELDGIQGLDISPNGRRLATCGTDPQIIIWNMLPILDAAAEQDSSVPKVLAILHEHQGFVLTVKFNNSGRLLASGSGDCAVLIFKQMPTVAMPKLGVKFVNLENWRPVASLKGHSLDVTALSWSPGDEYLATGSMDSKVLLWSMSKDGKGQVLHSLDYAHNGWVKGVAFDPQGRYLATQGRNGLKVWDVQCGWAMVTHQKKPFEQAPDIGFKYRISWSPDGEALIAVNSSSQQHLTFSCFTRSSWQLYETVGHKSAVLVAAANPRLFYPPKRIFQQRQQEIELERQQEQQQGDGEPAGPKSASQAAAAAGVVAAPAAGVEEFSDMPTCVYAAGSNDKSITLWYSELPRPLLQLQQLHGYGIVDMAWTPDGYTLLTVSHDRVAVLRFSRSELGRALTDAELKAVIASDLGTTTVPGSVPGTSNEPLDALAAAQQAELQQLAMLDDPAAAMGTAFPTPPRPAGAGGLHSLPGLPPSPTPGAAQAAGLVGSHVTAAVEAPPGPAARSGAGPSTAVPLSTGGVPARPPLAPAAGTGARPPAPHLRNTAAAAAAAAAAGGGALERRLMPQGNGITSKSLSKPQAPAQQQQLAGHKRAHQETAGGPHHQHKPSKRLFAGPHQQQATVMHPGGALAWVLPAPPVTAKLTAQIAMVSMSAPPGEQQPLESQHSPLVVVVQNQRGNSSSGSGSGSSRQGGATISLHLGTSPGQVLWQDKVHEHVVAATGSIFFTAAATASGLLYCWRPCGNPLMPPVALGCPPASFSAQGDWQLLITGVDGAMVVLDLNLKTRQLCGPAPAPNLAPLLAAAAPGTSLQDAWITRTPSSSSSSEGSEGSAVPPIDRTQVVVLTDGSGWLFHPTMGFWMMLRAAAVAPGANGYVGLGSVVTTFAAGNSDAERLRAAAASVASALELEQHMPRLLQQAAQGQGPDPTWQRREAHCQLQAAELLGDAVGYRRWLGLLVALLARQKEVGRLTELAQDLLGPERWEPSWGAWPWNPTILGLNKRQLLAQVLIPAAAREQLPQAAQISNCLKAANEHAEQAAAAAAAAAGDAGPSPQTAPTAAGLLQSLRLGPAATGGTAVTAAAAAATSRQQGAAPPPAAAAGTGDRSFPGPAELTASGAQQQQQTQHQLAQQGQQQAAGFQQTLQPHAGSRNGTEPADVSGKEHQAASPHPDSAQPHQQQGQHPPANGQLAAADGLAAMDCGPSAAAPGSEQAGLPHTRGVPAMRRLQATPVDSRQAGSLDPQVAELAQAYHQELGTLGVGGAAAVTGVEASLRIPLQEQQQQPQRHAITHPPTSKQMQPQEKVLGQAVALDARMSGS